MNNYFTNKRYKVENPQCINVDGIEIWRDISKCTSTNMYFIIKDKSALLIDPHPSCKVVNILSENNVEECIILLTHEHVDHTWGINEFGDQFNIEIVCQEKCAKVLGNPDLEKPGYVKAMLAIQDYRNNTNNASYFIKKYKLCMHHANRIFDQKIELSWKGEEIYMIATPGHSPGSCCVVYDKNIIFTGDSLLVDNRVILRIRGGNKKIYKQQTLPFFVSLDRGMYAFPGHGYEFRLSEITFDIDH